MTGRFRIAPALAVLLWMAGASPALGAPVSWQSWTFDYVVTTSEGLKLRDVTFQGRTLIASLSFPVMRVFYAGNACGPFVDRLGGTVYPIPWADDASFRC